MYSLRFGSRATRELGGCPEDLREALLGAIQGLAQDPRPPGSKKLSGALAGAWRIRVRSHRVIYDVYDKERRVLIVKVGPRKSIYR